MILNKNQNSVVRAFIKALPYLLIFYFVIFRSYFLLQQFQESNIAEAQYFEVFKTNDIAAKFLEKVAPQKDSSSQKRAVLVSTHEFEFLLIENFAFVFLLFVIIFYEKSQLKILSPPLIYSIRAPPSIC